MTHPIEPVEANGWKRQSGLLLMLGALVLGSRLPFLDAGYGLDPDAWRLARAAHGIATKGVFQVSRLPGHPVVETT